MLKWDWNSGQKMPTDLFPCLLRFILFSVLGTCSLKVFICISSSVTLKEDVEWEFITNKENVIKGCWCEVWVLSFPRGDEVPQGTYSSGTQPALLSFLWFLISDLIEKAFTVVSFPSMLIAFILFNKCLQRSVDAY